MIHGYSTYFRAGGLFRTLTPASGIPQESTMSAANTFGTAVPGHASANTKGAWTQLLASTANDAYGVDLQIQFPRSATDRRGLLIDIGAGPASSETPIIENITAGNATAGYPPQCTQIRGVFIPATTRLSCRIATSLGGLTINAALALCNQIGWTTASGVLTTYGADTANSRGVLVTGASAAYGSWVNIATTGADHNVFHFPTGTGNQVSSSPTILTWEFAYGPNTGALTIIGNSRNGHLTGNGKSTLWPQVFAAPLPSGTLLWARVSGSDTTVYDTLAIAA